MRGYTLSAYLLLALFSCSKSSSGLSEEKAKELTKVIAVFKDLPTDMFVSVAAEAVVEIENERMSTPLLAAFDAIANADAESKMMLVSQGLNKSMSAVNTMCKGKGEELIQSFGGLASDQRLAFIRKLCETERFELVRNPQANTYPLTYLLAHVALSELQSKGGVSKDETSLLRFLATAESPPMPGNKKGTDAGAPDTRLELGAIGGQTPGEENQVPAKAEVKIRKVETIGDMDKEITQRYVRRKLPLLNRCYEEAIVNSPELVGTVNASFTITPMGGVMQSRATGSENPEVESCIAEALKRTSFPKPKSGGTVDAQFSFELRN